MEINRRFLILSWEREEKKKRSLGRHFNNNWERERGVREIFEGGGENDARAAQSLFLMPEQLRTERKKKKGLNLFLPSSPWSREGQRRNLGGADFVCR